MMGDTFCVGEQVIVRDWDDMASEYGVCDDCGGYIYPEYGGGNGHCFIKEMKPLCGTIRTVVEVLPTGNVYINDEDVWSRHLNVEPWALRKLDDMAV